MSGARTPAGWYPDPSHRHQLRWWDGVRWSSHVADEGTTSIESAREGSVPVGVLTPDEVRGHVDRATGRAAPTRPEPSAGGTGGSVFDEPILVVSQTAELWELSAEYAVYDQHGRQVAAVRQVGQSPARKVLRALDLDQLTTHRYEVVDARGEVLLRVTRPSAAIRRRFTVERPDGTPIGEVTREDLVGRLRFGLSADGREVGHVVADSWPAWDISITDVDGAEVARITKTWDGLVKTMYTTADTYVVHVRQPLDEPLRSLVLACALCVDAAREEGGGIG